MGNQEKNKAVSFENLRKLGAILSSAELSGLVTGISKSRNALDVFCKKLKEHEIQLKKQCEKVVKEVKVEVVQQVEPTVSSPINNFITTNG